MKTIFHRLRRPLGCSMVLICLVIQPSQAHAQLKVQPRQVEGDTKPADTNADKPAPARHPVPHVQPKDTGKVSHIAKSSGDTAEKLQKHGALKHISGAPRELEAISTVLGVLSGPVIGKLAEGRHATRKDEQETPTAGPPAKKKDPEVTTTARTTKKRAPESEPKTRPDHERGEIFHHVQLTTKEAKDLEESDPFGTVELTGAKGKAND